MNNLIKERDIIVRKRFTFARVANARELGYGRMVYGDVLGKLEEDHYESGSCEEGDEYCTKKNWVLYKLGFPKGNLNEAAESFAGTEGWYQDFVGGAGVSQKNKFILFANYWHCLHI